MNHLTKQSAKGSAPVTVIGGIAITLTVLALLIKLMGSQCVSVSMSFYATSYSFCFFDY